VVNLGNCRCMEGKVAMRIWLILLFLAPASQILAQEGSELFEKGWPSQLPQSGVITELPIPIPNDTVRNYKPCNADSCGPIFIPGPPSRQASRQASGRQIPQVTDWQGRPPNFDLSIDRLWLNGFSKENYDGLLDGQPNLDLFEIGHGVSSRRHNQFFVPSEWKFVEGAIYQVGASGPVEDFAPNPRSDTIHVQMRVQPTPQIDDTLFRGILAAMSLNSMNVCKYLVEDLFEKKQGCVPVSGGDRSKFKDTNQLVAVEKMAGSPPTFRVRLVAATDFLSKGFPFGFESYRLQTVWTFSFEQPKIATEVFTLEARQYANVEAFDRLVAMEFVGSDMDPSHSESINKVRQRVQSAFINLLQEGINANAYGPEFVR